MTTLREAATAALKALDLGYDSAKAEADQYHSAMAGYRPERHAQMDAEVQQIAEAITALKAALAEPEGGGNLPPPLQGPTVAETATTQQPVEQTPPSEYRRGYWDGFAIGKREGRIEAEDALAEPVQEPDLSRCPKCGGPADNGHDRCVPPNPYHCTKCMAEPEPYDQTALELCETCGWKTLIPGDGCLNCERQNATRPQWPTLWVGCPNCASLEAQNTELDAKLAELERKPLTDEEIEKAYRHIWRSLPDDFDHTTASWIEQGIRYAEQAHGIK